ncbi:unnamed protein product [Kuraishia capsulata CBS 1993]|uniref:Tubulin gamma chain n=1 Tax=Kuraishia capsulata CBS 1993 TaxID=1382522 RepID=W6MIM4_9ASCO|nr:uncharacterized protein KUCA_T00002305001 [Kuraishia capsulata CBS 1993]CDK26334.1 unnamed protein product [Kuraishia capsulata CBS 1993]
MPGEILTIQAGQCGNQVGEEFWGQLLKEHGLDNSGQKIQSNVKSEDKTRPFFLEVGSDRYTPRAILLDLEPRVIGSIQTKFPDLFDPRLTYMDAAFGGAGNNWARGFNYGKQHEEDLLEIVDRSLDQCDSPEGFQLVHSVAGGTGSGMGSFMLELLSDRYPKLFAKSYSVFPDMGNFASEVVVQPYNTLLTLRRLVENCDVVIPFDNAALSQVASQSLNVSSPSYSDTNKLISTVMASITNSIRFPTSFGTSLQGIFAPLIPSPELSFIIPSFTPYTSNYVSFAKKQRRSTGYDVILDLVNKKNRLVTPSDEHDSHIAALDVLIGGSFSEQDLFADHKATIIAKKRLTQPKWTSQLLQVSHSPRSPYALQQSPELENVVNGLMLSNNSSIVSLLDKVLRQYDRLYSKKAFLNTFTAHDVNGEDIETELEQAREVVEAFRDGYVSAEQDRWLEATDQESRDYADGETMDQDQEMGN